MTVGDTEHAYIGNKRAARVAIRAQQRHFQKELTSAHLTVNGILFDDRRQERTRILGALALLIVVIPLFAALGGAQSTPPRSMLDPLWLIAATLCIGVLLIIPTVCIGLSRRRAYGDLARAVVTNSKFEAETWRGTKFSYNWDELTDVFAGRSMWILWFGDREQYKLGVSKVPILVPALKSLPEVRAILDRQK